MMCEKIDLAFSFIAFCQLVVGLQKIIWNNVLWHNRQAVDRITEMTCLLMRIIRNDVLIYFEKISDDYDN